MMRKFLAVSKALPSYQHIACRSLRFRMSNIDDKHALWVYLRCHYECS